MDVILGIEKFPPLSKFDINQGKIPEIALKIADFLRSIFLLSNTLLHGNNFIIYCSEHFQSPPKGLIIVFHGKLLRYLAPDERGILFLLLKIQKIITGEGGKRQEKKESLKFENMLKAQSTPGIFLKRGSSREIWDMNLPIGNQYINVGNLNQEYPTLNTWNELESKLNSATVLVFSQIGHFLISPPNVTSIYDFVEDSWKAKFYESELISYIQAKITE
ncbi:MAG: hypothetical protein EU530_02065 [Promethearchaeota archaeon]|nr:MAG: hypothetical protein EU530_02065 [Candidatus Lokiarchaeota archaeon]